MGEFVQERLNICGACPYLIDKICVLCGCDINNKTKNPGESCPHVPQKWGPYSEPSKVYKQAPQMKIAGPPPKAITQQPNECIPCKNRH